MIWSKEMTNFDWWEVELTFRYISKRRLVGEERRGAKIIRVKPFGTQQLEHNFATTHQVAFQCNGII